MANSMQVGNITIVALSDGSFTPPPSGFMPDVPAAAWEQYRAQHLDAAGNINLNLGSYLMRSGGRTVLVDTGIGEKGIRVFPPGKLLQELAAAGVKPEEIDLVLITHMHLDHIGWNTVERNGVNVPTFPNARYVIQRREWEYWTAQESAKELMERAALPIEAAGLLDLVEPEHHPTADLTMLPSPGHTPGHCCIHISSAGEQALILGDVAHATVQLPEPDWSVSADTDQPLARQTRRALWERIEGENLRVAAGHFPAPGFGRIVRIDGKRAWQGV